MSKTQSARIFSDNLLSVGNGTISLTSDSFKITPTLCQVPQSLEAPISDVYDDTSNIHLKGMYLLLFRQRFFLNRMT